jgi:hypothetical protein
MNTIINPTSSSSVSSLSTTTPSGSMTTLTTSMMSNGSTAHQPLSIIPVEKSPPLLPNLAAISCNNKSLDAKKYTLSKQNQLLIYFYLDLIY